MMKQMVSESVKAYIQAKGSMDKIRTMMQDAMADEIITDSERERIEEQAEALAKEIDDKYGWAYDLFDESSREAVKGSGIAASQESVDNLDARMTTMQTHTYTLMMGQKDLITIGSSILEKVAGIEEHTAKSQSELAEMNAKLTSVKNTMDDISLKGVKIKN